MPSFTCRGWAYLQKFLYILGCSQRPPLRLRRSAQIGCCCIMWFAISLWSLQLHSYHRNITLIIAMSLWSWQYHSDHRNITLIVKYFFAISNSDLSILFILYLSNYLFAKYYVLSKHNNFGRGRGRGAGRNKQQRYRQTERHFILIYITITIMITTNITTTTSISTTIIFTSQQWSLAATMSSLWSRLQQADCPQEPHVDARG